MNKFMTVFALFLFSMSVSATEVSCGGVQYSSSPYPGAGSKIRFSIRASEKEKNIVWSTKGLYRESTTFELSLLDHDESENVFRIEGFDENGDSFRAFIRYLTPEGVKLTIKIPGERWDSFRCSGITVDE